MAFTTFLSIERVGHPCLDIGLGPMMTSFLGARAFRIYERLQYLSCPAPFSYQR